MQLRSRLCDLCSTLLGSHKKSTIIIPYFAHIHHYAALSAKAHAAIKEELSKNICHNDTKSSKQSKKLRISCKRSELNHYEGQHYGKFDDIPLASKGWHHRKSRGDFFTIQSHRENPAISSSSDISGSFSNTGLSEDITCILEEQQITSPTVIQGDGIPVILEGHNTLLTAETGCGKTLAYLLPMIHQILNWQPYLKDRSLNRPLGVVISPNRELANQIGEVAEQFSKKFNFTTKVLTGGHTKRKMLNPTFEPIDLLVATLGAVSKLTTTGIYNMSDAHHVVLDEADSLLDDSFNEKLCHFLKRFRFHFQGPGMPMVVPAGVQLTLVSATMPTSLPDILGGIINTDSLRHVTSKQVHHLLPHVPQKFYRLSRSQKPGQLLAMVKEGVAKKHPIMIFSNKSSTCDWISMFLNETRVKCVNLNGDMPLAVREGKLEAFQSGEVDVMSCTDIGSRGVNTIRARHVINYDFPLYTADYIHRCGRTGRVGSVQGCHVSNFVATGWEVELAQNIELAARRGDALPNVNGNITRTIKFRAQKKLERSV